MAMFLQDTIEEMALERSKTSDKRVREFKTFMERVSSSNKSIRLNFNSMERGANKNH